MNDLLKYQQGVRDFIDTSDWKSRFAVSLTLRQERYETTIGGSSVRIRLSQEKASRNFRHFINLLSAKVYGTRWQRLGKRVRAVPVVEGGQNLRIHYHAMIECPREDLIPIFAELIGECWRKTDWGYDQVHVAPDADGGWVRYMTKLRSKPDFACSIDWMNYAH